MQFFRDINTLRAMWVALFAADAMARLAELRNCPVVTNQISTACLFVVACVAAFDNVPFSKAFIVMQ